MTKQPTCTETGEKVYTCSCGSSYKDVISKTGHVCGGWQLEKEATCGEEGLEVEFCHYCANEIGTRAIAKTDNHTPSDWIVTKDATETSEGTKVKKCMDCGAVVETASIEKLPPAVHTHAYTWTTNGNTRTATCSGCGATGITEEYVAGVWGYFDRGAAEELFSYVNSNRAVTQYGVVDVRGNPIGIATVPALTNFDGLYVTAKQRAAELATNFSHNLKTDNENIARGCENANACQHAWCYSSSHASTMTNNIYTQGSCAVFYYDADGSGQNLYPIYVLVVNK